MARVLFLSYDGLTDPLGQSQILPYLMGLTKFGHHFTIISSEKPDRFESKKQKIYDAIKHYPIEWVPLHYHKNPPVLSSVYDYRAMYRTAINLHKHGKFDIVHTRPGIPALAGLRLKKKHGIKFLNDVRGFWADERVDGKLWNLKNPLYKNIYNFFKKKEKECLQLNNYTTCLTYAAKEEMIKWNLLENNTEIEVIPCSVDLELFNPCTITDSSKQQLRQQLSISEDDFIISYLGSVGTWYMIDEMFIFFKSVLKKNKKSKFLIITPSTDHSRIKEFAAKYQVNQDRIILKELDRKDVPLHLSLSNSSVFFIKPCYSKISSSPTKHGEIMAMGIPSITNPGVGDLKEITEKYHSGLLVENFNQNEFDAVVDKMLGQQFDSNKIREGAKEYYSLDKAIHKYQKVYKKILEE